MPQAGFKGNQPEPAPMASTPTSGPRHLPLGIALHCNTQGSTHVQACILSRLPGPDIRSPRTLPAASKLEWVCKVGEGAMALAVCSSAAAYFSPFDVVQATSLSILNLVSNPSGPIAHHVHHVPMPV